MTEDTSIVFGRMAQVRPPRYAPIPNRVMMMTFGLVRGGAQRRMIGTALGLTKQGYTVRLVAMHQGGPGLIGLQDELKSFGLDARLAPLEPPAVQSEIVRELEAELERCELALPEWGSTVRPFARAILEFRPAVVHGWIDRYAITAGLAACSLGVPRIVIGQTSTTPALRGYPDAELLRAGYCALATNSNVSFVNVSRRCASEHEDWLGLEADRIVTLYTSLLPGAVRVPAAYEVADYRRELGIPSGAPLVGTIMRLEAPKDPHLWIRVAREIAQARPDVRFLIAGDGSLRPAMEKQIEDLGLASRVILAGPAYDVGLTYAALDAFLMTSNAEGLATTLIEAQAAGRPVVTTDVGSTREAVIEGVTGLVVRDGSTAALASAVLTVLSDPDWARRAAVAGPRFISECFGYDRMIAETVALYERSAAGL